MKKINDFGEKIGGARKDMWASDGLTAKFLDEMNEEEKHKYVTKNNIWPLPDAKKLVSSGKKPFIVYWQRYIRRISFGKPKICLETLDQSLEAYINSLRYLKDLVMNVENDNDIARFYAEADLNRQKLMYCIDYYNLKRSSWSLSSMHKRCINSNFPFSNKKRKKAVRKKSFIPPQLEYIRREGKNYRNGVNVNALIWQNTFKFRGVEFGNWMSQKDRQASMNYCYDAWKDLACVLDIQDEDISFSGKLALGFGSRGHSNALAHYEPLLKVINLTKMRGAGCTAHEWAHALDDMLASYYGILGMGSEAKNKDVLPDSFVKLIAAMKYDSDGNQTDFYKGSKRFNSMYVKDAHGYWDSNPEMFARAFACYVKDVYGKNSDYLFAHADTYEFEYENESISAIPQGEERELLDELFDKLFYDLKNIGFFTKRKTECKKIYVTNKNVDYNNFIRQNIDGQISFVV